ncbi:laminin G [Opitutaceae bacterium TAV4]|nr:laminin G [Opitutaceae bacterium TAV4]RRK01636.1 laminin G [Opitutaceae bacterium TAV3]
MNHRRHLFLFLLPLALIFSSSPPAHAAEVADQTLAWAHYTPWCTPLNTTLTIPNYYNYPLFRSTGDNQADWAQEYRQAKAQGIDGFFVDLVFSKNQQKAIYSDTLHAMLKAAEGSDFLIAPCLDVKTTVEKQVAELDRMLTLFGHHPNYPRYNNKPIVVTYTWSQWTPDEWQAIRTQLHDKGHDIYLVAHLARSYQKQTREWLLTQLANADAAYAFGFRGLDGMPRDYTASLISTVADEAGKPYMPGLVHGYYGAWLNGRNDFYQPHQGFDQLHKSFQLVRQGRDRWLHFTTWNDHDESSLLPMLFTTATPLLTKAYADAFKGIPPSTPQPEVCFAYHREEIPGTLLRIEAINLPNLARGPVSVKGLLLDRDAKTVATLDEKKLTPKDFDRAEWLIPTAPLAASPHLTPRITISSPGYEHTASLPPILLVNGWHQNAVTVKAPVRQHLSPAELKNTLNLRPTSPDTIEATLTYEATSDIASITLFRNDRPIAPILPATHGKTLMNLYIKGSSNYEISTDPTGEILNAARKFSEKNDPTFRLVTTTTLVCKQGKDWAPAGLILALTPDTRLTIKTPRNPPLIITARELAETELLRLDNLQIESLPADPTLQNHPALKIKNGHHTLSLLIGAQHVSDMYYTRYETTDGRVAFSEIAYPFATPGKLIPVNLIETSINLETSSGASGMKGESEYLSADVPFRTPTVVTAHIPPETIRAGHWSFDGHGRDSLGDMPMMPPPSPILFAPRSENNEPDAGQVLVLDGKQPLKMRLRTWPIGNATVDFQLNPTPGATKPQSVIGRGGWSDAININLLPDGRVEVVRNGNETVPVETLHSRSPLPFGQWSRLRVTNDNRHLRIYINDQLDAEKSVSPARSYGNSTWYLGGGYKTYANYRGRIDNLTVCGAAFAPGDPNFPIPLTRGSAHP